MPSLQKKSIFSLFFTYMLLSFFVFKAFAIERIDITRGHNDPLPLALYPFLTQTPEEQDIGRNILRVIEADLQNTGLFSSINKNGFIEKIISLDNFPHFASWRKIDATALMVGQIITNGPNLKVNFRLWDSFAEQHMGGRSIQETKAGWRKIAHSIADEIYTRLTGEKGYFNTRVAYISETGSAKKRKKRLAIMDQDGENHHFLTNGKYLTLTPRFSSDGKKITYLSYYKDDPRVYVLDLEEKTEKILGNFPGLTFAPRFSPDDKKIILSASIRGNSEIFECDIASMQKTQLTHNPGIDTTPSYSPDGKHIVFTSDRGGSTQLYVMRRDGSHVKRISFGKGTYSTPAWSPHGDWIAFTKKHNKLFSIGVMKPDGSGERLLTDSFMDEGPSWSPNGRIIMFTRQNSYLGSVGNATRLYSIDVTGYNEREILTPFDGSDPTWSPLLR